MYGTATDRQLSFITVLLTERKLPEDGPFAAEIDSLRAQDGLTVLSKSFASELIGYLMDLPKAEAKRTHAVRPGVYHLPDVGLVKIKQASGSKDKYTLAMNPVTRRYEDAPALMFALQPHMRLKAYEATTFGREHGLCPWCTEVLEPAASILQAMGQRCARKFV
jgi:hypothetical protein